MHVALTVLGLSVLAFVVDRVGVPALARAVSAAAFVMPVVILLEGARVACDARTTTLLYASAGAMPPPVLPVLRAHLAVVPVSLFLPAGRAGAEAVKAVMLAPLVGPSVAVVAAVHNPSLALAATFVLSIPVALAALSTWGPSAIAIAIAVQGLTAIGLSLFLVVASRRAGVPWVVRRFSARAGAVAEDAEERLRRTPLYPLAALGVQVVGRVLMAVELGLLAWAAGADPTVLGTLLVTGVQLVGQAAGDVVPGQLGVTDAAFALAAAELRMDAARALSIPLLIHGAQLFWAAVGALVPTAWPEEGSAPKPT